MQDSSGDVRALKSQLDEKRNCFARVPQTREELGQKRFKLAQIEALVCEVEQRLKSLEGFSLAGLLGLGAACKQQRIEASKTELEDLLPKFEALAAEVQELEHELYTVQTSAEGVQDLERAFERALRVRRDELLDSPEENTAELCQVAEHLDQVREHKRTLDRAIEEGRTAIERLQSLTKAQGRTGARRIPGTGIGVVGARLINKGLEQISAGSVTSAREGLRRLSKALDVIPIDPNLELDGEILRIKALLEEQAASLATTAALSDSTIVMPLIELVHEAITHVDTKRETLKTELDALSAKEQQLVLEL